jgi:CPA1 family monovalent cation:H+ antiporter
VVAITAGLAALRFLWVWASLRLTILRKRRIGVGCKARTGA